MMCHDQRSESRMTAVLLALTLALAAPASAAERSAVPPVNAMSGIASKGFDAVAYFATGQALPGHGAYTKRFKGLTYRFVSSEHRDLFAADPEKFLPQYGGYCAYAMAIDRIADIDPERWAIV